MHEVKIERQIEDMIKQGIIQESNRLGKAQYFSTFDLANRFHQVSVKQEDKTKTAFSTLYGHYEYIRMPFGLKNASFSRG